MKIRQTWRQSEVIITIITITIMRRSRALSQKQPTPSQPELAFNIERATTSNEAYRLTLYTDRNMQLVLMSLLVGEEIGMEVHPTTTQFIRVERGTGLAVINGHEYALKDGVAVVVPFNTPHNIINTSGTRRLDLYTIYSPPAHAPGTFQLHKSDPE